MNSAFKPDITAAGHQPQGFDEYADLYESFRVNSVDVEILASADYDANENILMCIYPTYGTTYGVDVNPTLENPKCEKVILSFSQNSSSSRQPPVYRKRIYPAKIVGLTQGQYVSDSGSSAIVTTNPTLIPKLVVGFATKDGTAQSVDMVTTLRYNVTFFRRRLFTVVD